MPRVVLVTGASKGLGRALAIAFSQARWQCVLTARSEELLSELRGSAPGIEVVSGDLTAAGTRERLGAVVDKLGRLDVLINNAGRVFIGPLEASDESIYDSIMDLNIKAPYLLTRQFLPLMKKQGFGHIINIISTAGKEGKPDKVPYCASKYALRGFTDSLRRELHGSGIRVTGFFPGGMKTNLFDEHYEDTTEYMQPDDVAEFVLDVAQTQGIGPDDIDVNRLSK